MLMFQHIVADNAGATFLAAAGPIIAAHAQPAARAAPATTSAAVIATPRPVQAIATGAGTLASATQTASVASAATSKGVAAKTVAATSAVVAAAVPDGTGGVAGQGGYLLPAGYLSTRGDQIVSADGTPVRIDAVGWDGTLLSNGAPMGLNIMTVAQAINNMKADGFNTIRLPWSNAMLDNNTMPAAGLINYTLNPQLKGLSAMQVLDAVIQDAGQAGMKVILDHESDEGTGGTYLANAGHQANGLWFDSGPGTDNTDGSGNVGTVTAASFQADWVKLAKQFAGNPTVIGFDLDNEPGPNGGVNWGQGGPTDLQAMATSVGDAIQQYDPGALIIVEGPEMATAGAGMPAVGPDGDLSGVAADPVRLTIANQVVYSVHEYPADMTGRFLPPPQQIAEWNAAWGYLESKNIAPVWVGEMGSSMVNGPQDQVWSTLLLQYMNGAFAAAGGPSVTGNQQPVGGDWWAWGYAAGVVGHTLNSDWSTTDLAVQAVTNQMLFIPKS